MSSPALRAAVDTAFDAPAGDQAPWRVLADLLLSEGEVRGEVMRLDLDAELGPLKGLAKVRHAQLLQSHWAELAPPGVFPHEGRMARGFVVECTVNPAVADRPEDERWRGVRVLRFRSQPVPPSLDAWRRTPIAGRQLVHLEELEGLEQEALEVLIAAPPRPKLRALRLWGDVGVPLRAPADWSRWWRALFSTHPRLKDVHLGGSGTRQATLSRLESLLPFELERVVVLSGPMELAELHAWRAANPARFSLVAELRQASLAASVELKPGELVLRAPEATRDEAVASIRRYWPASQRLPPVRAAP